MSEARPPIFLSQSSFGRPSISAGPTNEVVEISSQALIESFGATLKALDAMLTAAPPHPGGLDIGEVEVLLSISPEGKVAFANSGGIPMQLAGSPIRLTLRKIP